MRHWLPRPSPVQKRPGRGRIPPSTAERREQTSGYRLPTVKRQSPRNSNDQSLAKGAHHKDVIQSNWNFRVYVHSSGRCDVQATFDCGTDELRANTEVALGYLKSQPKQDWRRPKAGKLSKQGNFRDFYEIRFKAERVQQRPIGYFGPGAADFTILIWATEQGNALRPKTWYDTAMRCMTEIQEGKANARDFTFTTSKARTAE
jgi:hypothetical protein